MEKNEMERLIGRPMTQDEMKIFLYLLKENNELRNGIKRFVDKNYVGGSKADREDYSQMVSCRDIHLLRELIHGGVS